MAAIDWIILVVTLEALGSIKHVSVHQEGPGLSHHPEEVRLILGKLHRNGRELWVSLEIHVAPVHHDGIMAMSFLITLKFSMIQKEKDFSSYSPCTLCFHQEWNLFPQMSGVQGDL